jgi:O-antigen ligase
VAVGTPNTALTANPGTGTGPGTYEFTWLRDTTIGGTVLDAHSLYLELGAEAGIPGLVLGVGFVLALLTAGWGLLRLDAPTRLQVAGALAAICAFAFSAAGDGVWELSVIPIEVVLLAAAAFTSARVDEVDARRPGAARHPRGHRCRGAHADRAAHRGPRVATQTTRR